MTSNDFDLSGTSIIERSSRPRKYLSQIISHKIFRGNERPEHKSRVNCNSDFFQHWHGNLRENFEAIEMIYMTDSIILSRTIIWINTNRMQVRVLEY